MKKKLNILLYGPPGAGKGTQAELLTGMYGLNHISTGEVIRNEIKLRTPLGISMEDYIARGELAPDDLVIDMVEKHLDRHRDGAGNIFDGFPRTNFQARELDRLLDIRGSRIDVMFSLEVPDDELVRRLLNRGSQSGRADDMSEDVIRRRLGIYKEVTAIVSDYYNKQQKHIPIDGQGTVEEIFCRLRSEIDKLI